MVVKKNILDRIELANWKKTTYIKPHEYIIREKHPDLFKLLSEEIKKNGYDKLFYSKIYKYLDIGEYVYWCLGNVLNRQKKER